MRQIPYPVLKQLGEISVETFMEEYWQKKPLFIRQAFENFQSPINAEEIAGLCLEDEVTSRLVVENIDTQDWSVEHGPLPEKRFSTLPTTHWSLLVQQADTLDSSINDILNAFRFLPNWRLDDIMVSYASDHGGVGPHFDYYDVFLLQGEGRRRWRLGQMCDSTSPLVADQPMKILTSFDVKDEFIVEPGDLLYVPAGMAHWGEAIGESITYSIGFRAPSDADLIMDFSQELASLTTEDQRYRDPKYSRGVKHTETMKESPQHSGEITQSVVDQLQQTLEKHLNNRAQLSRWIGQYATELSPLAATAVERENDDRIYAIEEISGASLNLSPFTRCAFIMIQNSYDIDDISTPESNEYAMCFINGECFECFEKTATLLSGYGCFRVSDMMHSDHELIVKLFNKGYIELTD